MRSKSVSAGTGSAERNFSLPSLPTRTAAKVPSSTLNRLLAAADSSEPSSKKGFVRRSRFSRPVSRPSRRSSWRA